MDSTKVIRAVFSFFIPGLGQFMNGTIGKGLKFLLGFLVIWFVLLFANWITVQTIVCFILRVFCAYDAYVYEGF